MKAPEHKDIRDTIISAIQQIKPYDVIEENQIEQTLKWIASGEEVFRVTKPDTPKKHLVSYFIVLDPKFQKILLVDHKKSGLWLPPGGHVEIDEDPKDAVTRECMEELGIKAQFIYKDPIFITETVTIGQTAGHIDVSVWYIIKGDQNHNYDFDKEEFSRVEWFKLDEIPYKKSDPHMERFITKLKSMLLLEKD